MLTFRRRYLDQSLVSISDQFRGFVLDIGGKKLNKRGEFRPPTANVIEWAYVNMDPSTSPDYLCSAENIPLPDSCVDTIVMTEVLEYMGDPFAVLREINRLLKPSGEAIISVPFLMPIHNDRHSDFFRFTESGLRMAVHKAGMKIRSISSMGGFAAVTHDILYVLFGYASSNREALRAKILRRLLVGLRPVFNLLEAAAIGNSWINTGYFLIVEKGNVGKREIGNE